VDELGTTVDVGNGLLELGPHRIHMERPKTSTERDSCRNRENPFYELVRACHQRR
jgi:hypothetical protein